MKLLRGGFIQEIINESISLRCPLCKTALAHWNKNTIVSLDNCDHYSAVEIIPAELPFYKNIVYKIKPNNKTLIVIIKGRWSK